MNTKFTRGMSKATELTRAGRLDEATTLIKSLMRPASAPTDRGAVGDVLDGTLVRLDDAASEAAPAASPATAPAPGPRSRLGATLRRIAAGGMPRPGVVVPGRLDLPDGAQFLSLTHRTGQADRDYRLYVPAQRSDGPMPLIVMLHGCTQSPEDFAAGTGMNGLAEEFGCLIAWPAQSHGANAQKCWNWFRPEDQGRDRGEPALIAGIVRDILRDHPVDPARVYVAGLSAGGAAAAILGAGYPDLFAAVGVHSGLPVGGAQDVPTAFAAMRSGAKGRRSAHIRPDDRVSRACRRHRASRERRGRPGTGPADPVRARARARCRCLSRGAQVPPDPPRRRRRPQHCGALGDGRGRPCLGGWQCLWQLHRPEWSGRIARDASVLSAASATLAQDRGRLVRSLRPAVE
jgi:poly(hydroxyalkanoate) depolymerase family esterase